MGYDYYRAKKPGIPMQVQHFFDKNTATFTYVVSDPETKKCAIIDSVLDYDMYTGKTSTTSSDTIIAYIHQHHLSVQWILETHPHADHLTAAQYLKAKLGGKVGIGEHITDVLAYWVPIFNTANDTPLDGSRFDHLFKDGETFSVGNIKAKVLNTPGHTPACVSYHMEDAVFVGDSLFMPYVGTARTDFPGGSPKLQFQSIRKLLSLADNTRIFTCHDYPPQGQDANCLTTVAEQKANNCMIHDGISEADYIAARTIKDKNKTVPQLLLPSIQINLRAGHFGQAENNGTSYIKIPLNKIG